jgi:hypothetical protein
MNRIRSTLALAAVLPFVLRAAEAPPAADRPFDTVRQDLGALKSAGAGVVPSSPGLDLGAAAGISGSASFGTPPAVAVTPRQPEATAPAAPKSSGWLLDALEENSRKAGTGLTPLGPQEPPGGADDEQRAKSGASANDKAKAGNSTLPTAGASPLSGYMAAWLSPDEFRRLGALYPELTGSGPAADGTSDPSGLRRLDGPGASVAVPGGQVAAVPGGVAGGSRPQENPFVQAMQAPPRAALPAVPVEPARAVVPVSPAIVVPAAPEAVRPAPAMPEAPGADDRKYFPQLKRF